MVVMIKLSSVEIEDIRSIIHFRWFVKASRVLSKEEDMILENAFNRDFSLCQ